MKLQLEYPSLDQISSGKSHTFVWSHTFLKTHNVLGAHTDNNNNNQVLSMFILWFNFKHACLWGEPWSTPNYIQCKVHNKASSAVKVRACSSTRFSYLSITCRPTCPDSMSVSWMSFMRNARLNTTCGYRTHTSPINHAIQLLLPLCIWSIDPIFSEYWSPRWEEYA